MNRQELSMINSSKPSFLDVNSPRLFSGWPYFILLLAALLAANPARAGESKYSSTRDLSFFEFSCSVAKAFRNPKAADRCRDLSTTNSGENDNRSRSFSFSSERGSQLPHYQTSK